MAARQRYAILEQLLTTPPASSSSSSSSASASLSAPPSHSNGNNNNNGKSSLVRYASFSSLLELASEPLPKLSPREVDDVLGPNNAGLNVSLESIPPLFTPNNQCSEVAGQYHAHTAPAPLNPLSHASPLPPGPPKRSCSAPAAHLSSPFPPAQSHEAPVFSTPSLGAWRLGGVIKVSGGSAVRRPLSKSLITTSADILQSFEPVSSAETVTRPVGVAVARSGSLQEVTSELGDEIRKPSILRLFPSLQQQQQQAPRLLLATASSKPRPMAVVTPGRAGIHVDPLLCRVPGCEKLFRSAAARNQHYGDQHPSETFACPQCPIRLMTKTALDFHRRKKHQEFVRQSRECPVEGCVRKFYVDTRLLHHLRVHHRQRCLPCVHADCEVKFLTSRERDRHVRSEHCGVTPLSSVRHPLACADCHREFPSRLLLGRHRRRIHRPASKAETLAGATLVDCATNTSSAPPSSSPSLAPPAASTASTVTVATNTAKVPPCAICEAVFPSWEQLSTHLAAHARLATDMFEQQRQRTQRVIAKPPSPPTTATAEVAVGTEERPAGQQVLLACPFGGCVTLCEDHRLFREHFAKHFSSELPPDQVASLLPPDFFPPPATMPSLPFESPMEDTNCLTSFNDAETSSLFQALDLNLLSAITEVDDSGLLDQMLAPDLASALTLPNAGDPRSRCTARMPTLTPAVAAAPLDDADLAPGAGDDGTSCARTCPRLNQQMAELAKRRKALLLERVTLGFEPRPANPGGSSAHLKDVMRQIFHSKALPSKYQAPLFGEEPEVSVTDCTPAPQTSSSGPGPAESEAMLAPLTDWMLPGDDMLTQSSSETPLDPPMLDQLL